MGRLEEEKLPVSRWRFASALFHRAALCEMLALLSVLMLLYVGQVVFSCSRAGLSEGW